MDNLPELFDQRLQKLEQLENAITILHNKSENLQLLLELRDYNQHTSELKSVAKELLHLWKSKTCVKYRNVMKQMKTQQIAMLNLIEIIEDKNIKKKNYLLSTCKDTQNLRTPQLNVLSTGQRMYVDEFINSPFVTKVKPLKLNFLDFDAKITEEEFNTIPRYMRGRENVDELNSFLETILIPCFNEKYTLSYKKRDAVKIADKNIWLMFQQQNNYFPDKRFITQGDLSRILGGRLIDKKTNNQITMLKHLKVLKETRKESTICYLWEYEGKNNF